MDVVIKVNVEVAQITKLDTTAKDQTLTLGDSTYGTIPTASVTEGSTTSLGSVVIANKIVGTSDTNEDLPYYDLDAVTETVSGQVTGYNATTGEIKLADGTTLEQSPLYDVVKSGIEQPTTYTNATYVFTMDNNGKYLGAELANDASFIYGTFADYESAGTGTGTVNYYLTGVTLDGQIVTEQFDPDSLGNYTDGVAVTKKTWGSNDITDGKYTGYNIDSDGDLEEASSLSADWTITDEDVDDGYVDVGSAELFLTKNTKFIVVSGTGTDTLKVSTFNGIAELLGDADSVIIDADDADGFTYYTTSSYIYNNIVGETEQVDVAILPAAALDYTTTSSVYYGGNGDTLETGIADAKDDDNVQYALYVNGEKGYYYIDQSATGDGVLNKGDRFFTLTVVDGVTTADGQPVYTAAIATKGCALNENYSYLGATNNLDTGRFAGTIRTVTDAIVVDMTDNKDIDPIDSLADLNNAVSSGYTVQVDYVMNNADVVTTIYVSSVTK